MNGLKAARIIDGEFLSSMEALDFYIRKVMSGYFGGNRRTHAYGSSMDFADYREYTPGDDLRRIDWNLAGRFDKYYIRQYTDERQFQNIIYLDTSASMDWSASGTKGRAAMQLAAAMGYLSILNTDRAAYRLLRGSACQDLCGSIMGRDSFYGAMDTLGGVSFSGAVDQNAAIRADPNPGYDNGISFIVSDFLTDSSWQSAADYLLNRLRAVVLVQVLAPEEIDPVRHGKTSFHDVENAEGSTDDDVKLEVNHGAIMAYREAVAYFMGEIKRFCASRGVVFLSVRSDESIQNAILEKGYETGLIK